MRVFNLSLVVLFIGLVCCQQVPGQIKTQAPDDVVRTKTELVQTDVTVVDKRGRFVDGLSAEDFELRVDSKLQSISFFEQVSSFCLIKWTQSLPVPPGLYQVRVAVRDRQTGRTGSAMAWIEIPLN